RPETRARGGEASGCTGRAPSRSPRSASGCTSRSWAGRTGSQRTGRQTVRPPSPPTSGPPAWPWPWRGRSWPWISWSNPCFSCGRIYNNGLARVNLPVPRARTRRSTHATDEGAGEDAGTGTGGARRHRRGRNAAPGAGVSRAGRRQALLRLGEERPQGAQCAEESAPRLDRRSVLRRLVAPHRRDGAGPRAGDRTRPALPAPAPSALREVPAVPAKGRPRRPRFRHPGTDAHSRVFLVILTSAV